MSLTESFRNEQATRLVVIPACSGLHGKTWGYNQDPVSGRLEASV